MFFFDFLSHFCSYESVFLPEAVIKGWALTNKNKFSSPKLEVIIKSTYQGTGKYYLHSSKFVSISFKSLNSILRIIR